ncbi:hypothetical protein BDZ89DRAFT_1074976 [Hymenopellis radicata]|nr:hypothetical protein BDZ89DRAFT_1074976 [Hymenopellis radicata]
MPTLRADSAPPFEPSRRLDSIRAEAQRIYPPVPVAPHFQYGRPSTSAALRAGNRPSVPFPAPQISTARSTSHLYRAANMLRKADSLVMNVAHSSLNAPEANFGRTSRPESDVAGLQRASISTVTPRSGPSEQERKQANMRDFSFKHEGGGMNFGNVNHVKMSSPKLAPSKKGIAGVSPRVNVEQTPYQPIPSSDSDIDVELLQRPANPVPWDNSSSGAYICPKCENSFRFKEGLLQHQEDTAQCRHPTSLRCIQCHEVFPGLAKLRAHGMVHPNAIVPHSCWECDESFATRDALRQHIRTHKHARPATVTAVMCKTCYREFRTKEDLLKHQRATSHLGMQVTVMAPPTSVMDVLGLAPHAKFRAETSPDERHCAKEEVISRSSREQCGTVVTPKPAEDGAKSAPAPATFGCDQCDRSFPVIQRLDQHRRDAHKPTESQKLLALKNSKKEIEEPTEKSDIKAMPQRAAEDVHVQVSDIHQVELEDTPQSSVAPVLDSSCADLNAPTTVICVCKKRIAFDDLEDHYSESPSCRPGVPSLDSSRPDLTASTTVICTCKKRLPFADLEAHSCLAVDSSCHDLTTVVCVCKSRLAFDELEGHYARSSEHPNCYYGECENKGFVDQRALDEHMRLAHGDLRCKVCEHQGLTIQDLARHVKDEHTYFQCALCAEVLCGRESYVAHHMGTHPPRELVPAEAKEWQFFCDVKESHSTESSSGFSSVSSVTSSAFSSPSWQEVELDSDYDSRPASAAGYR